MTEPLRLDLVVACSVEHAFDVWANRIDMWWPRDHTASGQPGVRVVLERGRFGMYLPPLLEALGKAELTHEKRNNKVRALT